MVVVTGTLLLGYVGEHAGSSIRDGELLQLGSLSGCEEGGASLSEVEHCAFRSVLLFYGKSVLGRCVCVKVKSSFDRDDREKNHIA